MYKIAEENRLETIHHQQEASRANPFPAVFRTMFTFDDIVYCSQVHVEFRLFPTLTSVPGSGPPALQASHSAAGSSAAGHWSPAAGHHSWTAALSNY
jgi:hypothetical protein